MNKKWRIYRILGHFFKWTFRKHIEKNRFEFNTWMNYDWQSANRLLNRKSGGQCMLYHEWPYTFVWFVFWTASFKHNFYQNEFKWKAEKTANNEWKKIKMKNMCQNGRRKGERHLICVFVATIQRKKWMKRNVCEATKRNSNKKIQDMKWNNGISMTECEKWEHKHCRAIRHKVPLIWFVVFSRAFLFSFWYILHTNSSNCRQIFSINREICGSKYFCSVIFSRFTLDWKSLQKKPD